ncbi:MAG TPA: dihydrolipoamide acetyltransferase family protein [Ktedonosporobacter sp.]|jgi:pyruvate dehydrogenase E2 component (dihydrolipoamide acetyltransferase)|nr:dihydrolipoamide acetyltransferase family protein [Ktedonosporobacter sp.]
MYEFKLPDLGEGMQEAEIRRWLIHPGDTVKLDQPMVEVETDKAVVEIPSPVAARVTAIRVPEGKVAQLGEVLVVFDAPSSASTGTTETRQVEAPSQAAASTKGRGKARVLAAPAVRKRAFELGIDLEQVTPSQANGRVTMEDVLAYAERVREATAAVPVTPATAQANGTTKISPAPAREIMPVTAEAEEERRPLTGLRRSIAEHMERSWRTIPHASAFDELDGSALIALRQALKPVAEQRGVRLTYMPLLVKLLLPVLKELPIFNASLDEERREIIYKHVYHIGIATDTPEGLLVPVLRNADQLSVIQIAQQLERLIEGAQKRSLALKEVSGSTFTLNNVGSFGGGGGIPIINYPEVAILAVGRLQERVIAHNGAISTRMAMPLTMSFDHRLIDGALASRFMARFKELVENPAQLLLDMI